MQTADKKYVDATTISVDRAIRDRINQEARKHGLSQRQMVSKIIEVYDSTQAHPDNDYNNIISDLKGLVDKLIKYNNKTTAFIKEQEHLYLQPILKSLLAIDANYNVLIEILTHLE